MQDKKINRPKDNAIFQQQLTAWKPLMTFLDAAVFFLLTGAIALGLGVKIYLDDQAVFEYAIDYTDCIDTSNYTANITCSNVTNLYANNCSCSIIFTINSTVPPPVYFYYGLTNYFQNHRQLLNSYDINQLMGKLTTPADSCAPILQNNSNYYAPCGQLANAIFNDSFSLFWKLDLWNPVPWTNTGIALNSDLMRYGNPGSWNNTIKPPNWKSPINVMYPNGYVDYQELMVWMRPSFLPSFKKLHRILQITSPYAYGLPSGDYRLDITYNYPVKMFGGQKLFVISTTSWLGGKNIAMGILYLSIGILEIIIGLIFVPLHCFRPSNEKTNSIFVQDGF